MAYWEIIFFWTTLILYALATGGIIYSILFKNADFMPKMKWLVGAGFCAQTATIIARYVATQHLPWSGDYESGLMGGWFIIGGTLLVSLRNKKLQVFCVATAPLVIFLMGYGYMQNPELTPMAASLKTIWLYIHVYFAWLAFGAYALAMAAGVLFLLKQNNERRAARNPVYERFPSLATLDELIFRYIVFGFITDTIMISAGAVWAKDLWGSYWSWDPVETWSLVSWLIYGISIHLHVTFGWRERKQAILVIAALSTVIITFFGINLVVNSSLHAFKVR